MIYKAAPAWSLPKKALQPAPESSPAPTTYKPETAVTLIKAPSWKMGKELRNRQKQEKSPSPATYDPPSSEKINKMGIIGTEPRGKENHICSPGPGSYILSCSKKAPSISFASKQEPVNKTADFPGPAHYELQAKKRLKGAAIGRDNRFNTAHQQSKITPGPASYNWPRPNSANVRFGQAPRMSHQSSKESPIGPGQYDIRSDFEMSGKGFTLSSKQRKVNPDATPGPSNYSPTHYDLTSTPSISFSRKYKERAPDRSPSPNQYQPDYRTLICKTESYSLGKAQRLPLYDSSQSPGPGAYLSTQYSNTGIEISLAMSRKAQEPMDVPGPGAYNPNKEAVQKRPQTAKIGTSQRFYKIKTETCGSFYDSKSDLKSPKYSFGRRKRLDHKFEEVPGPGSYQICSSLSNLSSYAIRR